jgi:hypothetical protein
LRRKHSKGQIPGKCFIKGPAGGVQEVPAASQLLSLLCSGEARLLRQHCWPLILYEHEEGAEKQKRLISRAIDKIFSLFTKKDPDPQKFPVLDSPLIVLLRPNLDPGVQNIF